MKEWITGVIQNHKTVAVPVMTHPGIELTGKSVREACCDGQTHFEAIKALAGRYPTAAASGSPTRRTTRSRAASDRYIRPSVARNSIRRSRRKLPCCCILW